MISLWGSETMIELIYWTKTLIVVAIILLLSACASNKNKVPETEPELAEAPDVQGEKIIVDEALLEQTQEDGALQNIFFDFDKFYLKPKESLKL